MAIIGVQLAFYETARVLAWMRQGPELDVMLWDGRLMDIYRVQRIETVRTGQAPLRRVRGACHRRRRGQARGQEAPQRRLC
jgi:hypothetical protein